MLNFAPDHVAINNVSNFATGFDLDAPTFCEIAPEVTFPYSRSSNPTDYLKGGNNIINCCKDANAGVENQPNLAPPATNSVPLEWGVWQNFVEASAVPALSRVHCGTEANLTAFAGESKCWFKRDNPTFVGSFMRRTCTTNTTTTPRCFIPSSSSRIACIAGSVCSGRVILNSGSGRRQLQQCLLLH